MRHGVKTGNIVSSKYYTKPTEIARKNKIGQEFLMKFDCDVREEAPVFRRDNLFRRSLTRWKMR